MTNPLKALAHLAIPIIGQQKLADLNDARQKFMADPSNTETEKLLATTLFDNAQRMIETMVEVADPKHDGQANTALATFFAEVEMLTTRAALLAPDTKQITADATEAAVTEVAREVAEAVTQTPEGADDQAEQALRRLGL